jgi:hypothetical protein
MVVNVSIDQACMRTDLDLLEALAPELRVRLMAEMRAQAQPVATRASWRLFYLAETHATGPIKRRPLRATRLSRLSA